MSSLSDLRDELIAGKPKPSAAYQAKQLHAVPVVPVEKSRHDYLIGQAKGQTVLHVGASGPLHVALLKAAQAVYGLDRTPGDGIHAIDLDAYGQPLPRHPDVNLVICGEVLEHLSNPGHFLDRLRSAYPCRTIFTVPNAFSARGLASLNGGVENVNREHVAYYSYQTLTTLLTRHGYRIADWRWYHGHPKFAEGLIAVTE